MDLNLTWFVLLGVLLMGYAILDGFDLGVGILHLFVRGDRDRRLVLNSIGPLWDGNEVWLVTFGGALFAAFPDAYATILSGFYFPVMLILLGLIGRAVSLEFRSKVKTKRWRSYWDVSFFLSSTTVTFVFGVALGNIVAGVPLTEQGEFAGSLATLLNPFALLVGALALAGAAMHGSIYLYLKTEDELQGRVRTWMPRTFAVFLVLYIVVSTMALLTLPHTTANFTQLPIAWALVALNVLAVANIPRAIHLGRPGYAFFSSSCVIAALTFLAMMAIFPNLVLSTSGTASLSIYSAASGQGTLARMGIIALIGLPLVATYTGIVYWVFRGK
ncbi:MAG: cytochrome d ubiquinol oxidase subunit II, partial [Nannocystaceae bacterium]|nr:cytochrome d ubiquinol oxidase subunit II [Nannocystaceae bacterium]